MFTFYFKQRLLFMKRLKEECDTEKVKQMDFDMIDLGITNFCRLFVTLSMLC